jgi:hypothetical protein
MRIVRNMLDDESTNTQSKLIDDLWVGQAIRRSSPSWDVSRLGGLIWLSRNGRVCRRLKGFSEAITSVFPQTIVQT